MKKLILIAAAAGCLLTMPALLLAPQAKADSVTFGAGGVTVRDNDHRDGYRNRRHWRGHRAECREVTTRHRRPNGTIVIRKSRSC